MPPTGPPSGSQGRVVARAMLVTFWAIAKSRGRRCHVASFVPCISNSREVLRALRQEREHRFAEVGAREMLRPDVITGIAHVGRWLWTAELQIALLGVASSCTPVHSSRRISDTRPSQVNDLASLPWPVMTERAVLRCAAHMFDRGRRISLLFKESCQRRSAIGVKRDTTARGFRRATKPRKHAVDLRVRSSLSIHPCR